MVSMEASTVDALVKFCYSGEINISDTNVLSILPAARILQLDQVEELCCEFLNRKMERSKPVIPAIAGSNSCSEADEDILHKFENAVNTEKSHKILLNQVVDLILREEQSARSVEQVQGPV
ncbi:hypothetical protein COOONC_11301 [Cooperia oncophora]